jgi:hypothetical protein
MGDRYEISKPDEGIKTLSAQMSVLGIDKTVRLIKQMRMQGRTEPEVRKKIESLHQDLDRHSRNKIYQLSLGKQPSEDFREDEIETSNEVGSTTLELILKQPAAEILEGSVVFFNQKRWVVVGVEDLKIELKRV